MDGGNLTPPIIQANQQVSAVGIWRAGGEGGGGTGRIKLPAQKKPMEWLYPNCY